jgi:hypothetical protein
MNTNANAAAELAAYTPEDLEKIGAGVCHKYNLRGDDFDDALGAFILGAMVAASRAEPGRPIRAYQFISGRGEVLKYINSRCAVAAHEKSVYGMGKTTESDGEETGAENLLVDRKTGAGATDLDREEIRAACKELTDGEKALLPVLLGEVKGKDYAAANGITGGYVSQQVKALREKLARRLARFAALAAA